MWPDILDLRYWYQTLHGKLAKRVVRQQLHSFFDHSGEGTLTLGIGYCQPYLLADEKRTTFLAMPALMGGLAWPEGEKNKTCLCTPEELPFAENTFDLIFLSHCLEFSRQPEALLEACWHALRPDGRLVVMVPNRTGVWARREGSIFAQGHPYSLNQLNILLQKQNFRVLQTKYALFFPPFAWRGVLKFYETFEKLGQRWHAPFGGVVLTQARKDVFGMRVVRSRRRGGLLVRIPAMGAQRAGVGHQFGVVSSCAKAYSSKK